MERKAAPHNFLLIDFGATTTKFFLVEMTVDSLSIAASTEVLTYIISHNSEEFFKKSLYELEAKSGRTLFSSDILIISPDADKKGINGVCIAGDNALAKKIKMLETMPVLGMDEAYSGLLKFFLPVYPNLHILDVGSLQTKFSFSENGTPKTVCTPIGIGKGINAFLGKSFDLEQVLRWLPFEMDLLELENFLANKSIYARVIPPTGRDLIVEQAIAKEVIKAARTEHFLDGERNILLLSGSVLSHSPFVQQAVAVALDALQFCGVCEILIDVSNFLPCFGSLLSSQAELAKNVQLGTDCLLHVVTAIAIAGKVKNGENVGHVLIDMGLDDPQEIELVGGEIYMIPASQTDYTLSFNFLSGYSLRGGKKAGGKGAAAETITVKGGKSGLVIDVRGRPFDVVVGSEGRERIAAWNAALNIFQNVSVI